MRRRAAALWGAGAAVVLATLSHAVFWYGARERGGRPTPEAEALLRDPAWTSAIWIPFPHQNLGALERRVGEIRGWLALARGGEVAGARALPRFGPFAVPPASELVVAERGGGAELRVFTRVFPVVRGLARAAGRLAGNPWLAGGEVRLSGGRAARVAWTDGAWTLETVASPSGRRGRPASPPARTEAGLRARIRLGAPLGRLPAGIYRLVRGPGGLELRLGPVADLEPLRPSGGGAGTPLAWIFESTGRRRVAGLLLWEEDGAAPPFPAAATIQRGGEAPRLPGEELLRLAGRKPVRREAAGFVIRALGEGEAGRAEAGAAELAELLDDRPDLRLAAGADLDRLRVVAERIADRFRGLPIGRLAGFDAERLARLLAAAEGCGTSRLELLARPVRLRWRLCPGAESPPPD